MKRDDIFSKWKIRQLLFNLKQRQLYDIKEAPELDISWRNCLRNNQSKLYYRFVTQHTKNIKKKNNNNKETWEVTISYQKQKLNRLYDTLNLWRIKEYEILEKMNKYKFERNPAPNIVWNLIASKQVSKINRLKKKNKEIIKTKKNTWSYVFDKAKVRLERQYNKISLKDTTLFDLNVQANKNKLMNIHNKDIWNNCIYYNFLKIEYKIIK